MAKFTPSSLVSDIAGSVQQITFSHSKGGRTISRKARRSNRSAGPLNVRNGRYRQVYEFWKSLTDDERSLWNNSLLLKKKINSIGGTYQMSGFQLFMSQNIQRAINNQAPLREPAEPFSFSDFFILQDGTEINGSNGSLFFQVGPSIGTRDIFRVWIDGPYSLGVSQPFRNRWAFVTTVPAGPADDYVLFGNTADILAQRGFAPNQKWFYRLRTYDPQRTQIGIEIIGDFAFYFY